MPIIYNEALKMKYFPLEDVMLTGIQIALCTPSCIDVTRSGDQPDLAPGDRPPQLPHQRQRQPRLPRRARARGVPRGGRGGHVRAVGPGAAPPRASLDI